MLHQAIRDNKQAIRDNEQAIRDNLMSVNDPPDPPSPPALISHVIVKNMPFIEGQHLTVVAIPASDSARFNINIGDNMNHYALHFNPRMAHRFVVLNSLSEGSWGEEVRDGHFPFRAGVENTIIITFDKLQFYITLDDGTVIKFPNRQGHTKFWHVEFLGEDTGGRAEIK